MNRTLLKEIDLKSGKACVYELYGRDAREMFRIMGAKGSMDEIICLLITRSTTVDGKPVDMEVLDAMPYSDFMALSAVMTENFTNTVPQAS